MFKLAIGPAQGVEVRFHAIDADADANNAAIGRRSRTTVASACD
jgi:hypothetical protein